MSQIRIKNVIRMFKKYRPIHLVCKAKAHSSIQNVDSRRTQTMKQTISKWTVHKYRQGKHQLKECWAEWRNDTRNEDKARRYSVDNRSVTEWFTMLLRLHFGVITVTDVQFMHSPWAYCLKDNKSTYAPRLLYGYCTKFRWAGMLLRGCRHGYHSKAQFV